MTVYVLLWLCVIAFAYICKRYRLKSEYFMILSFVGMTILLGLRGPLVGEDTSMYIAIAKASDKLSWKDIFSSFPTSEWNYISYGNYGGFSEKCETMFLAYNKVIMSIFHSAQMNLFVTAVITNVLIMRYIVLNAESKNDIYMITYIYMCDTFFMSSFNAMRQIMAIAIAIQSINAVNKNKYKNAAAWITIATLIHLSSLLFVLVILIYKLKNKRRYYKWLIVGMCAVPISLPLITFIVGRISPQYASYLRVSYWSAQVNGTLVLWALIVITIIILIRSDSNDNITWWLIYLATIYIGIEMFALKFTVLSRVALCFRIGLLLLFPNMKKYFNGKGRLLYVMGVLLIMTMSYFSYASSPTRLYQFY